VGATAAQRFDARVITATHKDLEAEVSAGRFREDLFYRLNVVEIKVPPLRERRDDIPLLVNHFVTRASKAQSIAAKKLTDAAMSLIVNYDWPGNVRELENAVERAFILSGNEIDVADLPSKLRVSANGSFQIRDTEGFRLTLEEMERRYVIEILKASDGDKAKAANILGVDLSTLYRKLKKYEEV
jgi:DNA-binding NtrC family response regulator